MLRDSNKQISNIPNPSIKKGSITKRLLVFLEDTLLVFQKQFKGEVDTSEEVLNEHLGKTLNYHSKSLPFIFQQETIQKQKKGQNRKVDIGVFKHYAESNPFFTIEAKRLTTSLPKSRKKEYVIGDDPSKQSGGVERFKHDIHGVDLPDSAIVGYIQRENISHWLSEINQWITDLITNKIKSVLPWDANDLLLSELGFKDEDVVSKFSSENLRINGSSIKLNHYFVNLCS